MLRQLLCLAILGTLSSFVSSRTAQAQDPAFGFLYGYALGQANQFRYRLPAPPYFAIYPPVYYGDRYERPYGDSPFASWPTLQANPAYMPVLRQESMKMIPNPHCEGCGHSGAENQNEQAAPLAIQAEPRSVIVINPFLQAEGQASRTELVSIRP
jgi:hypothetical protein